MDIQIKNYADNRDLKALKYVFVDALDVDPTFVRYEEEYNYCKSVPGLLEAHVELTPFRQDRSRWDEAYWTSLKTDLIKNFSDRRMMHMKEVAQVFLAEKVERILTERSATKPSVGTPSTAPYTTPSAPPPKTEPFVPLTPKTAPISKAEQEKRELEEAKRKLDEENRRTEAARRAEAERIEKQRMIHQAAAQSQTDGDSSKKAIGIVLAVLAVLAVAVFVFLKLK